MLDCEASQWCWCFLFDWLGNCVESGSLQTQNQMFAFEEEAKTATKEIIGMI